MGDDAVIDRHLALLMERLSDRYDFLSILGEGGAGVVFEVQNRALRRREALKILREPGRDRDGAARFAHEARIAASLDHPRIVRIHEFGQDGGALWYSMQLVDGPTLGGILDAGGILNGPGAARVALAVLDALVFSHAHGVIHRDIKPANILFSLEGEPFLTDFGIAKAVENPLDTRTGQMLGTPAYVAPEQAMGEVVDARADLYSLGASLYKAVAGRLPFRADGVLQTLLLRLQEAAPPLAALRPDLHPALAEAIMRSLARDRADRWESAAAMRAAFLRACEAMGMPGDLPLELAREFPPARRPLTAPSRNDLQDATADLPRPSRPWAWGLAAALALVIALGLRARPAKMRPEEPLRVPPPSAVALPPRLPASEAPSAKAPPPRDMPAPRRAVVYPQLLGDAASPVPSAECGGMSVSISLLVGEDGSVKSCKVLSTASPACAEAARAVALRYRFRPALDAEGRPVQATVAAAVEFPESK